MLYLSSGAVRRADGRVCGAVARAGTGGGGTRGRAPAADARLPNARRALRLVLSAEAQRQLRRARAHETSALPSAQPATATDLDQHEREH